MRIYSDPRPPGNLVRRAEAYPGHIIRQLIGILPDNPVDLLPVSLVDAHRERI